LGYDIEDLLEGDAIDYIIYFLISAFLIPTLPMISLWKLSENPTTALGADYLTIKQKIWVYIAAAGFGGIINFIILIYQSSKLFQSNNKKQVDIVASASSSTILGNIFIYI